MKPEAYEPAIREEFGDRADDVLKRYPLGVSPSAGEVLATVRTDAAWSAPTLDTARLLSEWVPTRMGGFSERDTPWFDTYPTPSFDQRARHMSELAHLFDMGLFQEVKHGQARFRDRMISTWVELADSGRTNRPRFQEAGGYVQTLASGTWKRADFTKDHDYPFWKNHR